MQEQIDLMILERVSNGFFDLSVKYSIHSRDIEREYKSRGFKVRSDESFTTINWANPQLDKQQPNKRIFSFFTAQQLYYVLTTGKDLRYLTSAVVYEKLIREKQINETYGMEKTTVYNLFNQAITLAEEKGYRVVINDQGVITSHKNMEFDVNDVREIDQGNIDNGGSNNWDDLLAVISRDKYNSLEIGTDEKLYVNNPLKSENW